MKFSYTLLKKLVPGIKDKIQIINALTMHAFEAEDLGGDSLDISIPANRYSDAACHLGMAREISAILNLKLKEPIFKLQKPTKNSKIFSIEIKDKNLCPRYVGQYFENIKIGSSPKWIQEALKSCGLRPINNIVDIINYVMLEIGEPMHAFDYDKLGNKKIIIRRAEKGEKITTLDNEKYNLNNDILIIADREGPLAIAGIKGGKKAEIDKNTKKIILEAANFDGANIYKTHKKIGLTTDAAVRFSHNISPALTMMAVNRASQLLKEIAGAKPGDLIDKSSEKPNKKVIRFEIEKFNKLIGIQAKPIEVIEILKRLGFNIILNKKTALSDSFLVEVLSIRNDIELFEDLTEEIARILGYDDLKTIAPHVVLNPSGFENELVLKDKARNILVNLGLDEVYNTSFCKEGGVELQNPVAEDKKYLRSGLMSLLEKNIFENFRFFDEIKIFEIGKIFNKSKDSITEQLNLGIAVGYKNKKADASFYEIKGILEEFFKKIGLINYLFGEGGIECSQRIEIYSGDEIIGYAKHGKNYSVAEVNLDKILEFVEEEFEYRPLSKYPSVIRDISVLVSSAIKIGDVMQEMQMVNIDLIKDVDLVDEYEGEHFEQNKKSLTFKIIFQAEDRTLTDKEIEKEMKKIYEVLSVKFRAQIR